MYVRIYYGILVFYSSKGRHEKNCFFLLSVKKGGGSRPIQNLLTNFDQLLTNFDQFFTFLDQFFFIKGVGV